MFRARVALGLVGVALLLLSPVAARADDDTAVDLAFWQSIQNSTDPAEYQAYLDAFPHGKFAKLAVIRAHPGAPAAAIPLPPLRQGTQPTPAAQPTPPQPTAETPPPAAPADNDAGDTPAGKMVLVPAAPRVGQIIRITCEGFPQPTSFDQLVIVPAGTPVMDPSRPVDQSKVVWNGYAMNCFHLPLQAGPFAPGAYEVRFMTRLYNNDGVFELHGMTPFRVR
jgi:hypothetical protein